jgi:hypothetical protein
MTIEIWRLIYLYHARSGIDHIKIENELVYCCATIRYNDVSNTHFLTDF